MDAVSVGNSFARNNYKSMRAASAKGLINEPGSNNCFLNSAVQVLWHLDVFRRSFRLLSAHRCTRDSCIFCALKVVFTQFEYSDHAQIAPDQLRKALAACTSYLPSDDDQLSVASGQSSSAGSASVAQFALGSMADACECLENLLLRLHAHLHYSAAPAPGSPSPCTAAHCLTHAKFAMHVRESLACNSCGARTTLADYVQLVYYVATHAILANVRTTSESYGVPDAFGRALRAAASVGELRECCACKQRGASLVRQLACSPDVLGVGLVWNSASPSAGTLTTLYEAIGTSLRVHDLFDSPDSGSSSPAGTQPHQLVGVVCYVGRHYATFMYHSRTCTWILFDDSNVKEIGRSWHLVVARCLKCRFVPVLLLYANPAAHTIDAACVPQTTMQISNAELLRTMELANAIPPAAATGANGSLSRGAATHHERSSSLTAANGGSSLERNSRMHKKARPAVFQSRVRAVASVDNLQNAHARSRDDAPDLDDDAQFGFGQLAARATLGRVAPQSARDSAVHRRQNSLVHALGIADDQTLPFGQLTAQVLRTRGPRRYDEQQTSAAASLPIDGGTLKRVKSLENVVGGLSLFDAASGGGGGDLDTPFPFQPPSVLYGLRTPARTSTRPVHVADESARLAQNWAGAADGELNPRAIEALGFRQQFADLLAKADALVREASECERASSFTDALLRVTQAAICLKQASDLPAIEQSSRLAAVSRQNACNSSVKRLHRTLNELAGAADMPLGQGNTALAASADRQDSGVSTWSEDPSGHSTASEELFTTNPHRSGRTRLNDSIQIISVTSSPDKAALPHSLSYQNAVRTTATGNLTDCEPQYPADAGEDAQLAYANTLTQLGPYATLPRKPKTRMPGPNASEECEPLYAPQSAFAAQNTNTNANRMTQASAQYGTLTTHGQQVVLAVRSTRRATRNEEIYATYTQMNQFGVSEQQPLPTQAQPGAMEQPRAAGPPPPKPNAALIRQRMEQLQQGRQNVQTANLQAQPQSYADSGHWMPQVQVQYAGRPVNQTYQDQAINANANATSANNGGNSYQMSAHANTGANVRNADSIYARRSELTMTMTDMNQQSQPQSQSQAIVARSTNANKLNQPFKTPQPVRRTFVLDAAQVQVQVQPTPSPMAYQSAASSYTHATPASFTDGPMQPAPTPPSQYITRAQLLTSAGNAQLQMQQRNAAQLAPAPASPSRSSDPQAQAKLSKKKVTFLDDLIAKQAERVRQNMAQMGNSRRNDSSPAPSPAPFAGNAQMHHANLANSSLRRAVLNANASEELFSDSSLSSLNSNSTRQSIPIGNRFAYNNLPVPVYTASGHDADNETSSSIASSVDLPMPHSQVNAMVCKLCQQRSTAYPDSYCSACAVYMSKLIPG